MGMNPGVFWGPQPAKNPALTDKLVAHAERKLGVTLPATYVQLLRTKNGGATRGWVCPTTERAYGDDYVILGSLFGIGRTPDDGDGYNILLSPDMISTWDLPPRQVLLMGEGHWWLSLDYRTKKRPPVVYIDVEYRLELTVSGSFAAFYAALLPNSALEDSCERLKPREQWPITAPGSAARRRRGRSRSTPRSSSRRSRPSA